MAEQIWRLGIPLLQRCKGRPRGRGHGAPRGPRARSLRCAALLEAPAGLSLERTHKKENPRVRVPP
eukprot:2484326-Alexandrium_andersonii.AAC.1